MPDLSWDNELADIAQRWAIQCNYGHDQCRDVDRFAVGQNVGRKSSGGGNNHPVESFVQSWFDEVAQFNKDKVPKYKYDQNTNRYTQVVWADTTKIGCGIINYNSHDWHARYLVCNYGPRGNLVGQKIYEKK